MPTNRRYRLKQRRHCVHTLDASLEFELQTGQGMLESFPDVETMRAAWEIHREQIIEEWITEKPGTRPFAWWLFEGVPRHGERLTTAAWTSFYGGNRRLHELHGILHTQYFPPAQEEESKYLLRHGYLSPEEQAESMTHEINAKE